jgi:hypothetical protein
MAMSGFHKIDMLYVKHDYTVYCKMPTLQKAYHDISFNNRGEQRAMSE